MIAYCYASGLIEFGTRMPNGALPIVHGRAKMVRETIEATARHGYKTHVVDGRPTKISGTECLLVPGVPEATDENAAVDALLAYTAWIRPMMETR